MSRRIVFTGVVATAVVLMASPAWAHVTIAPDSAQKGASDVEIAFRVPNEETTNTTKIDISIPTDPPLLGVLAQQVPGWTAKVVTTKLPKPIETDDGSVTDAVSEVTWTADDPAAGIKPDEFGKFEIIAGQLPADASEITFKAIQTYANGDIVRWIESETPGGPAAEHPAPVLSLTSGTSDGATTATTTPASTPSASASATASAKNAQDDADTAKTIGIVAIIFAVVALFAVAFAMFRKRPATS
jgi:uncharacterized protein YcnI